jgi:hypothetical protein
MANVTTDLDGLMSVLFLLTLALYLAPASFGPQFGDAWRPWMRRAATATLGLALLTAAVASLRWLFG